MRSKPNYFEVAFLLLFFCLALLIFLSLDKCNCDSQHLLKMVQGTYLYSLVKIRSVTAEIFLIWTNVARTNVAWTNVIVMVSNCSRWSHEPTFLEKSGK